MTEIEVRLIELDDLPALYRLIPRLWSEQGIPPNNDIWENTSAEFIKRNLGELVFGAVAVDPDNAREIVSCGLGVIWEQLPTFWNTTGRCGHCQWFYTAPEFRGKGLGAQIMQLLMNWYSGQGVTRVYLNATPDAIPFYKRFGFETADEYPEMVWREPGSEVNA